MWYVVWTSTGSERKSQETLKDLVNRVFIPRKIVNIKVKGEWTSVEKPLFPGYLFVDTENVEELVVNLRQKEDFNQVLSTDKKYFPLYEKDAVLAEKMYNENGVFDISEGYINGDKVIVTSGPLCGLEGYIKKINRHKRLAYLEFDMFEQKMNIALGLEILDKR